MPVPAGIQRGRTGRWASALDNRAVEILAAYKGCDERMATRSDLADIAHAPRAVAHVGAR